MGPAATGAAVRIAYDGAAPIVHRHVTPEDAQMVRIRLRRVGRKKAPVYRIVIADSKSPRDGKFIEIIGTYSPRLTENAVTIKVERANYWLDVGAQASDTVRSLLRKGGVLKARHEARLAKKLQASAVPLSESKAE
jgi:small subunit ribosomal protein S16